MKQCKSPNCRSNQGGAKHLLVTALFLGFLLFSLVSGCQGGLFNFGGDQALLGEKKQALDLYHQAWQVVFDSYVDPSFNGQNWVRWKTRYDNQIKTLDDSYAAIRTMLASLNDPYSRFLNPKVAQDQNMHIDSRLFGVGIQIANKNNQLLIIAPLEGSPAERAGLKPLDKITAIDGESTADLSIEDAVEKIRGPKGSSVALSIVRNKEEHLEFKLVRDEIVIKTVFGDPINNDIGYIRVSSFISQDTSNEMREKLLKQSKTKALILDIRGNNGGLLPNALDISDMFLDKGEIVSIIDRDGMKRSFNAKPGEVYKKPMVILIDAGSASASEILSGALKDNNRATLIGTKTFGKGLVQKINYLDDGSEINLTISKYYTPAGHDIDKKGIMPDILVDYTESDFQHDRDPQKDYAVNYLRRKV